MPSPPTPSELKNIDNILQRGLELALRPVGGDFNKWTLTQGLQGIHCLALGQDKALAHNLVLCELMMRGELIKLNRACQSQGRQIMVFKGGSYIYRLYPKPGLRPLSDVDLLVRPQDGVWLETYLVGAGYLSRPPYRHVFSHPNGAVFDLHLEPLSPFRRPIHRISEQLWKEAQPLWEGSQILAPSLEHELLLAILHACKHNFTRAIWLIDIALLFHRVDRARFLSLIELCRCQRLLRYCCWLLRRRLDVPLVPWLVPYAELGLTGLEKSILSQGDRVGKEYLGPLLMIFSIPSSLLDPKVIAHILFPGRDPLLIRLQNLWQMARQLAKLMLSKKSSADQEIGGT